MEVSVAASIMNIFLGPYIWWSRTDIGELEITGVIVWKLSPSQKIGEGCFSSFLIGFVYSTESLLFQMLLKCAHMDKNLRKSRNCGFAPSIKIKISYNLFKAKAQKYVCKQNEKLFHNRTFLSILTIIVQAYRSWPALAKTEPTWEGFPEVGIEGTGSGQRLFFFPLHLYTKLILKRLNSGCIL